MGSGDLGGFEFGVEGAARRRCRRRSAWLGELAQIVAIDVKDPEDEAGAGDAGRACRGGSGGGDRRCAECRSRRSAAVSTRPSMKRETMRPGSAWTISGAKPAAWAARADITSRSRKTWWKGKSRVMRTTYLPVASVAVKLRLEMPPASGASFGGAGPDRQRRDASFDIGHMHSLTRELLGKSGAFVSRLDRGLKPPGGGLPPNRLLLPSGCRCDGLAMAPQFSRCSANAEHYGAEFDPIPDPGRFALIRMLTLIVVFALPVLPAVAEDHALRGVALVIGREQIRRAAGAGQSQQGCARYRPAAGRSRLRGRPGAQCRRRPNCARRSRGSPRTPPMRTWRWSIIPGTASRRRARISSRRSIPISSSPQTCGRQSGRGAADAGGVGEGGAGDHHSARCLPVRSVSGGADDRPAGRDGGGGGRAAKGWRRCVGRRRSASPTTDPSGFGSVIGFAAEPGAAGARWRAGREFALCGGDPQASVGGRVLVRRRDDDGDRGGLPQDARQAVAVDQFVAAAGADLCGAGSGDRGRRPGRDQDASGGSCC